MHACMCFQPWWSSSSWRQRAAVRRTGQITVYIVYSSFDHAVMINIFIIGTLISQHVIVYSQLDHRIITCSLSTAAYLSKWRNKKVTQARACHSIVRECTRKHLTRCAQGSGTWDGSHIMLEIRMSM